MRPTRLADWDVASKVESHTLKKQCAQLLGGLVEHKSSRTALVGSQSTLDGIPSPDHQSQGNAPVEAAARRESKVAQSATEE